MCQLLFTYCNEGWPDKNKRDSSVRPYWEAQGELTVGNGMLMLGNRIVIPKALQMETLKKLHEGH